MKKSNNNQNHKKLSISNKNIRRKSTKKICSYDTTPKSCKHNIKKNFGKTIINFGRDLKNNSKNRINENKSIEKDYKNFDKINSLQNLISMPKKVIKIVSSPSITALNNTISNNTINNNANLELRKNKTSYDYSSQFLESEDISISNNLLFQILNKYKINNINKNKKINDEIADNENNEISKTNANNNQSVNQTKPYYGSFKNNKRKNKLNYRTEDLNYKSFNKKDPSLKKTLKEKCDSKRSSKYKDYKILLNKTNNNINRLKAKSKSKKVFTHQKSNPLIKKKINLNQSQNEFNNKRFSKQNFDSNGTILYSFVIDKRNIQERYSINNSFLTRNDKEKEFAENNIKVNSININENKNKNEDDCKNLVDDVNNDLNELKKNLTKKIENLEKERNDLKVKISELSEENERSNKIINDNQKLEQVKKVYYNDRKNSYEEKIKDNNDKIIDLSKKLKELRLNNNSLNIRITNLNKEKNHLKNEINFKNNEYNNLMNKKKEIYLMLQKEREKTEKNNNEIKKIIKENNELKSKISNYILNIDEYKQLNNNFQLIEKELKEKIKSLKIKNDELITELEKKNNSIQILNRNKSSNNIIDNYFDNQQNKAYISNRENYQIAKEVIINYLYKKDFINKEIGKNIKHKNAITSKNYDLVKIYSINKNLKWYLFRNKGNDLNQNNHNDQYIWISNDNIKNININEFLNNSNKSIKNSLNKSFQNEKDIANVNNNFNNLLNKKGIISNKEINESKKLLKSNTENGLISLSFINKDEKEASNFIDDHCFEDILKDLGDTENNTNNYNIYNIHNNNNKIYFNTPKRYYPNNINNYFKNNKDSYKKNKKSNLKETIDVLLTQITPNSKAIRAFKSILSELGCFDDEILNLIGNYNEKNKK